jgi:hypothetical protein
LKETQLGWKTAFDLHVDVEGEDRTLDEKTDVDEIKTGKKELAQISGFLSPADNGPTSGDSSDKMLPDIDGQISRAAHQFWASHNDR